MQFERKTLEIAWNKGRLPNVFQGFKSLDASTAATKLEKLPLKHVIAESLEEFKILSFQNNNSPNKRWYTNERSNPLTTQQKQIKIKVM